MQPMVRFFENSILYFRHAAAGLKYARTIRLSSLRKVFSLMSRGEKIAVIALGLAAAVNLFLSLRTGYERITIPVAAVGGAYTEGMVGQPSLINPLLAYQDEDITLTRLVFSGLYRYDGGGEVIPDLADGMPQISEDQKQYTVNLKKNVRWHNDQPFSADDVVFTFAALKDPAYKSPLRTLWLSTSVEKTGDFQVKFTTKDISGPFLHNLTLPIISRSVWGSENPSTFTLSDKNLQAIGTGPYSIREIKKLKSGKVQQITLGSFAHYHGERAKVESLTLKFYETEQDLLNALHSKEVEGLGYVPSNSNLFLDADGSSLNVLKLRLPQYQVAFFNTQRKALGDREVRRALQLATDRQAIIREALKDNALLPAWPYDVAAGNPGADAEAARRTLDAAGWKPNAETGIRSKKGTVLEFTISTNDSLLNSKAAEMLARQWETVGAKVHLNILPSRQLTDTQIKTRNFEVLVFPQKLAADPDPFLFWHSSQMKDPGLNLTGFDSAAADKLITEARTTTNQELREQKYREFYALLEQEAPAILLSQTQYVYAVHDKIKNVGIERLFDPTQRFYSLPDWYIEQRRAFK